MEGPSADPGINYRAIQEIFCRADASAKTLRVMLKMACLEFYNDTALDLLGADSNGTATKVCRGQWSRACVCVPLASSSQSTTQHHHVHSLALWRFVRAQTVAHLLTACTGSLWRVQTRCSTSCGAAKLFAQSGPQTPTNAAQGHTGMYVCMCCNHAILFDNKRHCLAHFGSVVCLDLSTKNILTGLRTNAKVNLVDLAGSERLSKSNAVR